jgi:hypothetical protein
MQFKGKNAAKFSNGPRLRLKPLAAQSLNVAARVYNVSDSLLASLMAIKQGVGFYFPNKEI